MRDERENNSAINLSATDGIPKVSFGTSSADATHLTPEEYNIDGNEFTAYYDGAHKLVFVLDSTVLTDKPNVLLIINSIEDRKWDDILANDYNMDLETVRPKKDNKYQKLDIEYSGLPVYNKLINEYKAGNDLEIALAELSNFRTASIRRAAADRLVASEEAIVKTRETISKTGETMRELQARLKKLREKLAKQKKEVGKEPTKQSAAKILKTESQIDATNEKLKRAKKRLTNAQRRLAVAEEDAEIARRILGQKEEFIQVPIRQEIKQEVIEEPKAEEMAEEVKPLFDQDPEILDDKIAFKPIEFGAAPVEPVREVERIEETVFKPVEVPPAPLSFTPPAATEETVFTEPVIEPTPVLETITSVEPVAEYVPEPVVEPMVTPEPEPVPAPIPAPVVEARPVSPIAGPGASSSPVGERRKPTALYYIMLVVLIVLSVFTLWLYQKNTGNTVPELTSATPEVVAPAPVVEQPKPEPVVESPFVVEPEVIPEPVYIEPEPIFVEPEYIEPEYIEETEVPVQPEPEVTPEESSWIIAEPTYTVAEPEPVVQPKPKPVVNKPAYNVGGERNEMFVADDNYETDYDYAPQPVQVATSVPAVVCDDGTAPDSYGCCSGEIFTEMDGGGLACCPVNGGTCFPPL